MSSDVKERRKRRRRGSLSREQVVEAALALADAHGLDALTMTGLARKLDCGVMTIYGYVADKEQLLDEMALRGMRDVKLSRPLPTDVSGILEAWGRALRAVLLEHPSIPVIFLTQPVLGPGIIYGVEALLGALTRAGMSAPAAAHAIYAVVIYATGFAAWEIPRTRRQTPEDYASRWRQAVAALPPPTVPLTSATIEDLVSVAGEDQFEIGLQALAHGLTAAHTA
jgi:AcrR family transcriptional regulator